MTPDQSLRLLALPAAITDRWIAQLGEPQRHYHTLAHITALLAGLGVGDATRELVAAIWLHDIVYDPAAGDNEERSAEQALADLAGSGIDAEAVAALVRGTKHHRAENDAQRLLNDLDLSILGADPDAYDAYAAQIRREYAHVPEELYRPGRANILRRFDAMTIYQTPAFQRMEAQAHANLRREIAALA